MLADLLSAGLRGLSFVAMAQAAGAVLFLILFGSSLQASRWRIARMGAMASVCGLLMLPAQFALEAARMAGSLSGLFDIELQRFALSTSAATVLAVRMVGMTLLAIAAARGAGALRVAGLPGVGLVAASFALIGHTVASPARWLLAPLLVLHLLVVFFWLGALRPLIQVAGTESTLTSSRIVEQFSRLASLLVPMILLAGIILAACLLPNIQALRSAYGMGLIAKLLAFTGLMLLAALNKWRLGPALAQGGERVRRHFVTAVALEASIIVLVLLGTAALTSLASPS